MKNLSFRHEGLKTGTEMEQRVFFASYIVMGLIALTVIGLSISELISTT